MLYTGLSIVGNEKETKKSPLTYFQLLDGSKWSVESEVIRKQ